MPWRSNFHTCISVATLKVYSSCYNLLAVKDEEATAEAPKHYSTWSPGPGSSHSLSGDRFYLHRGCMSTWREAQIYSTCIVSTAKPVSTERNAALIWLQLENKCKVGSSPTFSFFHFCSDSRYLPPPICLLNIFPQGRNSTSLQCLHSLITGVASRCSGPVVLGVPWPQLFKI